MAGLESKRTQDGVGEALHTSDQQYSFEAGADSQMTHGETTDLSEPVETALESSDYAKLGFKSEELQVFRARHEGEFTNVLSRPYSIEKFGDPDDVVQRVNPFHGDSSRSYDVNCADCARSTERTWRGDHEEAAGRAPRTDATGSIMPYGEASATTEEWAGEKFTPVSDDADLLQALAEGGHGSSAIVHSSWEHDGRQMAGGHAYNIVNFHDELRVLDGQSGQSFSCVPDEIHPEIGRNPEHRAMAWNARGVRIW